MVRTVDDWIWLWNHRVVTRKNLFNIFQAKTISSENQLTI